MKLLSIPVVNLTSKNVADILQKACINNENIAYELIGKPGLRGNVTAKFVEQTLYDTFNSHGKMRNTAKKTLQTALEEAGMKKNTSLRTFLKKFKEDLKLPFDLQLTEKDLRIL